MAKYKVLKPFKDTHTKERYKEGQEIEMLVKRADEVASNLDNTYLERLDVPEKE